MSDTTTSTRKSRGGARLVGLLSIIAGVLLIAVGLLLVTDYLTFLSTYLQQLTPDSMVVAPNAFVNFAGGLSAQNTAAIVGAQIQFDNIGSATSFKGVILQLGSTPFSAMGGIGLNSTGGSKTWPGLTKTEQQTVTNTTTTTVSAVSVSLDRTTYLEVPWSEHVN